MDTADWFLIVLIGVVAYLIERRLDRMQEQLTAIHDRLDGAGSPPFDD
jgi:hypothetical protein